MKLKEARRQKLEKYTFLAVGEAFVAVFQPEKTEPNIALGSLH